MWRVIILVKVYSLLVSHVDCKLTALGDPIGPLGPTIIEKPNKVDDDLKVVTDAINAQKLSPDLVNLIASRTADQRAAIDAAYLKATGKVGCHPFQSLTTDTSSIQLFKKNSERLNPKNVPVPALTADAYPGNERLKKPVNGASLIDDINGKVDDTGKSTFLKMVDPKTMRPDDGTDATMVEQQFGLLPIDKIHCDNVALEDFLTSASFAQIKLVVEKYNGHPDSSGKPLADKMKKSCPKGLRQEIYKRIVRYAAAPYEYLAEEFNLGITGNSFNTQAHRYQLIARSEIDLKDIISAYASSFGHEPQKDMDSWAKDEYTDLFLAVLNGNPPKK
ncbi:uncharacterized protein LOC111049535 [Nilaparvata lugens]|uniref:uncharacterized protein LOC111049535 n=1 Tax=Nilaparvata lugens TaxID=108931 RepID=UPI00193E28E1|nr:uncharacterized protein LOC111049535 [Nilaparvata lugens]